MNIRNHKRALAMLSCLALLGMIGLSGCAKGSAEKPSAAAEASVSTAEGSAAAPAEPSASANEDASAMELDPVTKDDVNIVFHQYYDASNYLNLEITEGLDAVKSVHFLLFYELGGDENTDAQEFIYLGEDNNMDGDYDTGKFQDNFDGFWPSIAGELVTVEVIEETEEYTLFSIPCIIDGQGSSIRAMYDNTAEEYKILGRYDGVNTDADSQMTSRGVKKIDNGAQVVFTFTTVENGTFDEYEYQMQPITWSDDLVMEDTDLGDGVFLYMYEIEDVFGTEIDADAVEVEVNGEDITWLTELE